MKKRVLPDDDNELRAYARKLYKAAYGEAAPWMMNVIWAGNEWFGAQAHTHIPHGIVLGDTAILPVPRMPLPRWALGALAPLIKRGFFSPSAVYTIRINTIAKNETLTNSRVFELLRHKEAPSLTADPYATLVHELQHVRDHVVGRPVDHDPEFEARVKAAIERAAEWSL